MIKKTIWYISRKVKIVLEISSIFRKSDNIFLQAKQFGKRKDFPFISRSSFENRISQTK